MVVEKRVGHELQAPPEPPRFETTEGRETRPLERFSDDRTFEPPPLLRNPHAQTILSRAARARLDASYRRSRLDTPDGDFVDLDLLLPGGRPRGACLLLHGLEGCARSGYMLSTAKALAAHGLAAVALNFRSCSGEPNRTPQSYHAGRTDDIALALRWTADRFGGLPLAAAGFSLGGNALLKLLGGPEPRPPLVAAAAISVPYDLSACADALDRGLGRLYGRWFLGSLRRKARAKAARFPDRVPARAARAATVREFDDLLTAPVHGFGDAETYYAQCSARRWIGSVDTPTLLLQAADDPLVPARTIPRERIAGRPELELLLTRHGGHVGFLDRGLRTGPEGWMERAVAGFLAARLAAPGGGAAPVDRGDGDATRPAGQPAG